MPAVPDEPIANPGLPAHTWRPTDLDEGAAKRAERQVSLLFTLSAVCTVLFVVSYFVFNVGDNWETVGGLGASTVALGVFLGLALMLIGVGIIQWARKLMADVEIVEMRHPARSSDEDRQASVDALNLGLEESGLAKRPMIRRSLFLSVGVLLAPVVVLLRDLGPTPGQVANAEEGTGLEHTFWGTGTNIRVVRDVVGTPIRPSDLEIGDLVNGVPDGIFDLEGVELQVAKAKAAVIMVKMEPDEIKPGKGREDWSLDGIICYSKICSHVGCPISLYERTTHHVLCPCHQSTFDLADSAKVVFGPAGRPLPQLPLAIDDDGYLVAQSDFTEPVGPSYWSREK
ncbi:ubiquinol-cytochrome c reductase iron-sulfur subunit [Nocardioides sp.]|uniref:cytochrome bc1 complex Rieske iron-sulfur subunit n=1 Tax=Nocardioides sp. TaxID=35761 RepID=UPI0027196CA4|nr:Rieske 2Fe-2S domain-containing protein [Nocardioides sp.]MDO9458462.1 Rieske 2Fe-2S domain-containing protein [Nocardioides sp.]